MRASRNPGLYLQTEKAKSLGVHVDRKPTLGESLGEQGSEGRKADQPKGSHGHTRRQNGRGGKGGRAGAEDNVIFSI